MNSQSRGHSRSETPLPPPPPLRERGDSGSSQQGASSTSSAAVAAAAASAAASAGTIQIPAPSNASVRSSPQKTQIRTYDSKLISREMDRLAMHSPTPPIHSHSHSHSHTGTPLSSLHSHSLNPVGSVSTLSLVPNLAHSATPTLTASPSLPLPSDDPWSVLHLHVLPMFNGEPLRIAIEDLNALVKAHLQTVISKSPSRAINTLENDVIDLLSTGMITLNAKLSGMEDDKLLNRVVDLWGFFWTQLLPYVEGVFLPLQMSPILLSLSRTPRVVRSTSPVESTDRESPPPHQSTLTSAPIDVRALTLRSFRDAIILPIFERLHNLLAGPQYRDNRKEYSQPKFQQMLLVLGSLQTPSGYLSMSEIPLLPGEHAITHLLRAVRNPSSSGYPSDPYASPNRRKTMGPSSFSGGAPRDRRGRIARRDDAFDERALGLIPGREASAHETLVGRFAGAESQETPTVNGQNGTLGNPGESLQHMQRLRDEREFLDSLRSPDVERDAERTGIIGDGSQHAAPGRFANMQFDYDSEDDRSEDDFGTEIARNGAANDWEHVPR